MSEPQHPRPHGRGSDDAWGIIAYLLSGMLLGGGAGWVLDRWLGTPVFLVTGLLAGTALAFYVVYVRFGSS